MKWIVFTKALLYAPLFYVLLLKRPRWNLTPLFNLRPLIFGLTHFSCFVSVWVSLLSLWEYYFCVRPFWLASLFQEHNWGLKQGVGVHKPTQLKDIIMFDVNANQILKIKLNSEMSDEMRDTWKLFATKNTDLIYFTRSAYVSWKYHAKRGLRSHSGTLELRTTIWGGMTKHFLDKIEWRKSQWGAALMLRSALPSVASPPSLHHY